VEKEPKRLGLTKVGSGAAGTGKVKEIRMGSRYGSRPDDGLATVSIQFGDPEKPKPAKKTSDHCSPCDYVEPKISEIYVEASVAKGLSIGQKVKVSIVPA
jgi:hypothetical protein